MRGQSLWEYLASFVTTPGIISLLMFLASGAMPTLVTLSTRGRVGAISLTHAHAKGYIRHTHEPASRAGYLDADRLFFATA